MVDVQSIIKTVKEWVAGWVHGNFFHRSAHQHVSSGEASADLPIVLGYKGKIDPSFIDETTLISDINPLLDHGLLTGLSDDDHAQYLLLAGRGGGQLGNGGSAANADLILRGTSHATKDTSYLLLQDDGGYVGVGKNTPTSKLDVVQNSFSDYALTVQQQAGFGVAGTWPLARFGYNPSVFELNLATIMSSGLARFSWGMINNSTVYTDMLVFDRGNIGIGNADPIGDLEVFSTAVSNIQRGITSSQFGNNTQAPLLNFMKARGSRAAKAAVANADGTGAISSYAWDGSAWVPSYMMMGVVNGVVAAGAVPVDLTFWTGPTSTLLERMRIVSNGNVGINQTIPDAKLHVVQASPAAYALTVHQSAGASLGTWPVARFAYIPGSYELNLQEIVSASLVRYSFGLLNSSTSYPDMLVFDRGNIGIGTQLPAQALDVVGSITASGHALVGIATPSDVYSGFLATSLPKIVQVNDPAITAGTAHFGALVLSANKNTGGDSIGGILFANLNNAGAEKRIAHIFGYTGTGSTDGVLIFATAKAGVVTEAMRITEDNFVGINAGVPTKSLHIGGGGQTPGLAYDGIYANPNAVSVQITAENSGGIEVGMVAHSSGNGYMGTWSNSPLVLRTNNADRITVAAAGAVTIAGSGYVGPGVAAIPGLLYSDAVTRGNTTTAETNLGAFTVTGGTLAVDGSSLSFWAWGLLAANANGKTVKVYFGADVLTAINSAATSVGWSVRGTIQRKTATTQSIIVEVAYGATTATVLANWTRTLSVDNIFKLTGQATATNDIQQYGFKLWWDNAN